MTGKRTTRPRREKTLKQQVTSIAAKQFGIEEFRPGQEELIFAALNRRDSIGIMPTGSGKSLCFQLPSLLIDGLVLVVSPLISLMKDQHDKLMDLGIPAAKLNSTVSAAEEQEIKSSVSEGSTELIYVTPERLENDEYVELLKKANVALVVIDEAHCITQWGHDFRPAYTALASAIKNLGRPPVMALTATATDEVLEDIVKQLQLNEPLIVKRGIDRPNLIFQVRNTVNESIKREQILEILDEEPGIGIIYTSTVKSANELVGWMQGQNVSVDAYHGKLGANKRKELQDAFMDNQFKVMVATKAFGMGIDKPDVRFVIHYQFPDSVESYYQEAGRAGRDEQEAKAILLYQLEDKRVQSYFLGGKYPSRSDVSTFLEQLEAVTERKQAVNLVTLAESSSIPKTKLRVIANYLESAGIIKRGRGYRVVREFNSSEELEHFLEAYESRHQSDKDRLQQMMHYAQNVHCRVRFIRRYFGEDEGSDCGRCDNCTAAPDETLVA